MGAASGTFVPAASCENAGPFAPEPAVFPARKSRPIWMNSFPGGRRSRGSSVLDPGTLGPAPTAHTEGKLKEMAPGAARKEVGVMTHIVGDVMTREVVEARRETPLKDLARLLDRHRISGLPVVDHDDKVLGVISETDLVRRQAARSADRPVRRFRVPALDLSPRRAAAVARAAAAEDLMTSPAITVHPEQRVADAARVMERHGVERLPV